jgi:hypothetical protein
MTDHETETHNCEFELNPFVSDVALWIDQEVIEIRPEFKAIDLGNRIARICLELHESGVATAIKPASVGVWIPTAEIEARIGGSSITANSSFSLLKRSSAKVENKFQIIVRQHSERRLASILEYTEILFSLCNEGLLKIIGVNSKGSYMWGPTLAGTRSSHKGRPHKSPTIAGQK